ncbi:MAG TPA: ABC transporter substrate-binding protein [Burkholderiales bacterium]|nr:ABC transporter substrate-binding protein [Burkholderiales bacterium]
MTAADARQAASGLALVLALWGSGSTLAQEAPDVVVKQVAAQVVTALREDPDLRSGNPAKMAQLIEQVIAPHFDFERMTRLAVGRAWRQASPDQRKALIEEFRTLLIRSYSTAYSSYKTIVVNVKPLRLQGGEDDVQVKSEIKLPGDTPPISVDYSMYKSSAEWKVYDVTVDGVSLVTTYRSTFAEEIQQNGIDGLIKSLRDKNAQPFGTARKQQ